SRAAADRGNPASINEIVSAKQAGLSGLLHYDAYERRSGLVRILPLETAPEAFADGSAEDLVDTLPVAWELASLGVDRVVLRLSVPPIELRKTIEVGGG